MIGKSSETSPITHVPPVIDSPVVREGFSPLVDIATTKGEVGELITRSVLNETASSLHNLERHPDHTGL